mgnify:CR=1 FL=1
MKIKKIKVLVLLSIFTLILSACNFSGSKSTSSSEEQKNSGSETAETQSSQVLNLIEDDDIATLDVMQAHDAISNNVLSNTFEGLYGLDQNSRPVLTGADDHQVSEDGLSHTFILKENKWSNGDPVTAHDYEFAWKRTFRETGFYTYQFVNAKILNADSISNGEKSPEELGVTAKDDKTLVVTLSEPSPLLPSFLLFSPFFPVNQKFVESQGENYGLEADQVVYNGPFVITEWKHDQGWKYEINENYWGNEEIKLDEINVFVVKEESTAINLYDTGKVDRVEISSAYVDQYKEDPNYSIENRGSLGFLRFNHKNAALSNKNIRRAIDMAWDKKGLADVVLNNGSSPTYYLVPESAPPSPSKKEFREVNGDFTGTIEDAKKSFQQGLEEIGQDSVTLSILAADATDSRAISEYFKSQVEKNLPGLTIEISVQPFQRRLELEKAIDYDISISTYVPLNTDPISYLEMFETGGNFNRMDYSNPQYDELIQKAKSELDLEKRYEIMLEAEKVLFEDAAIGPMYQGAVSVIQQPYVKGLVSHPALPEYSYKWITIEGK